MKKTWTTRDGRKINVRDMTDQHIQNTLSYFRKREQILRLKTASRMQRYIDQAPDGAADACEQELCKLEHCNSNEFLCAIVPELANVLAEARRRKLEPKPFTLVIEPEELLGYLNHEQDCF